MLLVIKPLNAFTDSIYHDGIHNFSAHNLISLIPNLLKFFLLLILCILVALAVAIFRNNLSDHPNRLFCLQFLIASAALTCALVFLISPYFISHLYWAHNGVAFAT
jgi:hypothetical protein